MCSSMISKDVKAHDHLCPYYECYNYLVGLYIVYLVNYLCGILYVVILHVLYKYVVICCLYVCLYSSMEEWL